MPIFAPQNLKIIRCADLAAFEAACSPSKAGLSETPGKRRRRRDWHQELQRMDIKLAQGVAAGIATGDTDPADPGLLKQRAKDEALLPGDHFAGFA